MINEGKFKPQHLNYTTFTKKSDYINHVLSDIEVALNNLYTL